MVGSNVFNEGMVGACQRPQRILINDFKHPRSTKDRQGHSSVGAHRQQAEIVLGNRGRRKTSGLTGYCYAVNYYSAAMVHNEKFIGSHRQVFRNILRMNVTE